MPQVLETSTAPASDMEVGAVARHVEAVRRFRAANPERVAEIERESKARLRARDPERYKAQQRERDRRRRERDPSKGYRDLVVRRARKAQVKSEPWTRDEVWARGEGRCHICTEPLDPASWHADHVVPIARGGRDAIDNLLPTHPSCNQSKGAKLLTEIRET